MLEQWKHFREEPDMDVTTTSISCTFLHVPSSFVILHFAIYLSPIGAQITPSNFLPDSQISTIITQLRIWEVEKPTALPQKPAGTSFFPKQALLEKCSDCLYVYARANRRLQLPRISVTDKGQRKTIFAHNEQGKLCISGLSGPDG